MWQQNLIRKSSKGRLYISAVGHDILKFEQILLFYNASYFNLGDWSFVSEGLRPLKSPCGNGTVWQNFILLFNAIDSENSLGYAICQACKICQLPVCKHDRAQSGTTDSGSVYSASWGKTFAGTILPSFEGIWILNPNNWLKWSCGKYNTQRQFIGV